MQAVSFKQAPLILQPSPNNVLVFIPGQVLSARVISAGPDGLVNLALAGQIVQASTQIDLEPEQQIRLQVQDSSDGRIQLKMLADPLPSTRTNSLEQLLRPLGLPLTDKTMQIVSQLKALQLPITQSNINDLARLNSVWQSPAPIGLLIEQIAADLDKNLNTSPKKDILSNLKNLLELFKNEATVRPGRPAPELAGQLNRQVVSTPAFQTLLNMITNQTQLPLKDSLQQAVDILTAQQLRLSAEPAVTGAAGFYGWQFPFVIPGQLAQLAVAIRREAGSPDQPDSQMTQVVINLDTAAMGPQSYDLRISSQSMGVSVTVANETSRDLVMAAWPELAATLASLGYQAVLTNCTVGPVPTFAFSPAGDNSLADWRRVDIKI